MAQIRVDSILLLLHQVLRHESYFSCRGLNPKPERYFIPEERGMPLVLVWDDIRYGDNHEEE